MDVSRRRAVRWLVVPVVAALAAAGLALVATPAQAQQNTIRGAAGNMLAGVAVTPNLLNNSTYANIVNTHFSSLTAENQMKMDALQPSQGNFNFGPADQIVAHAQQNNQTVYGHTLVWHNQSPGWIQGQSGSQMQQSMQNHITTVMQRYGNSVPRWDVANEVIDDNAQLRNSFWLQAMGESYINQAFQYAQQAQPNSVRCLNDYSIDGINAKSNAYFNRVQQMLQQGVPINCMGFQAHLILGQVPGNMQQNLQRFANLGLEIWVTELDIRMNLPASQQNLQQQATEYAQVYSMCQGLCRGITTWGVHEEQSWVPSTFPGQGQALIWGNNMATKPALAAVIQALGGGGPQVPAAPTGLTVSGTTNSSISLSWSGSTGATGYVVERAPGTSGGSFTQVGTASGTSFTNTGLSADQTFRYRVVATNTAGSSPPSGVVTGTTTNGGGQVPAAPTGLTVSGTTNSSISLSWSGSTGATGYVVERAPGTSGGSFTQVGTASGTSFTNTGLSADQTFRYRVVATNTAGSSPPSGVVTGTTTGGGTGGCSAVGTLQTQWQSGYVVQPVTVTNTGSSSIGGWSVTFTLPAGHSVVGSWNAQLSATSGSITATNMGYNGALSGGGNTSFGFQVSRPDGNTQTPGSYTCTAS